MHALPWPVAVIDFEANSLEQDGYPIEVGLTLWPVPDAPVEGWSAFIRPSWRWTANGHWNAASAKVCGIRGSDFLAHGRDPADVAAALNQVLGYGGVAWCDGGAYDAHWMQMLFEVGGVRPLFTLCDWTRLVALPGPAVQDRTLRWLAQVPVPYRARGDSEQLLALAHGDEFLGAPSGSTTVSVASTV